MNSSIPAINEASLQERLDELRATFRGPHELIHELEHFLRTAADDRVVRINPIGYASEHGRDEGEVIELFLHARKAGLLVMEWQYVCRVCGTIVESFRALNTAGEHFFCKACIADREADLSDFVAIGFTVSKAVRVSAFHDPDKLSATELFLSYNTSAAALAPDDTTLRDFYARHLLFVDYVEPGATKTMRLDLKPGFIGLSPGPEILVDPACEERVETSDFTHSEGRPPENMKLMSPGPLAYTLTNASPEKILAVALGFTTDELPALLAAPARVRLGNFLSGARLLSTQSFLDLFPTETVMSAGGLAVKNVALMFTDIKGSTALYERIGDMKAFGLVRQHFGVLRDVITANHGALVKTIGDAVMASFHDPVDAVRSAIDTVAEIQRFNDAAGEYLITLKIGAHTGPCVAVTLNERLDYFGHTVNLAARVQGVAAASEICVTDELYRMAGAAELCAAMQRDTRTVHLDGIERDVMVHVLHPAPV